MDIHEIQKQQKHKAHITKQQTIFNHTYLKFLFPCGAATQRGSWPPNSWGFLQSFQLKSGPILI
jgi:hypothetical protein